MSALRCTDMDEHFIHTKRLVRIYHRYFMMKIWPAIVDRINYVSDQIAPLLWESYAHHHFIWCSVCRCNIRPGKVREVYVEDFAFTHFRCPGCSIDHYLDLSCVIPTPIEKRLINIYNERVDKRNNDLRSGAGICGTHRST